MDNRSVIVEVISNPSNFTVGSAETMLKDRRLEAGDNAVTNPIQISSGSNKGSAEIAIRDESSDISSYSSSSASSDDGQSRTIPARITRSMSRLSNDNKKKNIATVKKVKMNISKTSTSNKVLIEIPNENKIFVEGLPWTADLHKVCEFFKGFGEVTHVWISIDSITTLCKGFGFLCFKESSTVDKLVDIRHFVLEDKVIEVKRPIKSQLDQIEDANLNPIKVLIEESPTSASEAADMTFKKGIEQVQDVPTEMTIGNDDQEIPSLWADEELPDSESDSESLFEDVSRDKIFVTCPKSSSKTFVSWDTLQRVEENSDPSIWEMIEWYLETQALVEDSKKMYSILTSTCFLTKKAPLENHLSSSTRLYILRNQRGSLPPFKPATNLFKKRQAITIKIYEVTPGSSMFWKKNAENLLLEMKSKKNSITGSSTSNASAAAVYSATTTPLSNKSITIEISKRKQDIKVLEKNLDVMIQLFETLTMLTMPLDSPCVDNYRKNCIPIFRSLAEIQNDIIEAEERVAVARMESAVAEGVEIMEVN